MADVSGWMEFLLAFQSVIENRSQRPDSLNPSLWQGFLGQFKTLHSCLEAKPTPTSTISAENFARFISDFEVQLHGHYENGHGINVWEIAGLSRDEVRNSAVLAWLLDRNGSHGKKSLFLAAILAAVRKDPDAPARAKSTLPTIEDLKNYRTRVESLPLGDTASRVDIEIEGGCSVFIEVKIHSPETNNQLERYIELAKYKEKAGKWAVLFLTRKKSRPLDSSLHDNVISISWKEVAFIINRNIKNNSFGNDIIRQFCRHINQF